MGTEHTKESINQNQKKRPINLVFQMKILDNPLSISNEILTIIKDSKVFLYLISPYIQFGKYYLTELKSMKKAITKSLKRDINVNLITRPLDKTHQFSRSNYETNLKFMHVAKYTTIKFTDLQNFWVFKNLHIDMKKIE